VRVKFCEAYIERAHRTLADIGLAPKLYFCAQVRGRVNMVIMEFVEGRDAHHQFNGEELPPGVMRDVKLAVEELHRLGLVFGDLRRSNIMICRFGRDVDRLDWAGDDRQAQYPALLNDPGEISWADGVAPAAAARMKKRHDLDMIEKLHRRRSVSQVQSANSQLNSC
ncbi:hypothetical protein BKA93DRAFT_729806, partial [Sparassis latifolia]